MRAVVCRKFGAPELASVETLPAGPLTSRDVRIAVKATGVSFANLLVLQGKHQNTPTLPFTPGTEVAGVVIECGPEAKRFRPGDRVMAGVRSGGFASEVVAPESNVFALNDKIDFVSAVQFPTIYATAYAALAWRAQLRPDEVLLVHGSAGASGLAAVEIGKALGARVIATASTEEKLAVAREHGAHHLIDYRKWDFREQVLDLTNGRGADVIFDPVGGDVFDQSLRCISSEGRLLVIGFANGRIPIAPANIALVKNIAIVGLYWGYYMGWAKQQPPQGTEAKVREAFETLTEWFLAGKIRPQTHSVLPLSQFAQALDTIAQRQVVGKVVLEPEAA